MDEVLDDEGTTLNVIDSTHIQSKERGFSIKAGSSSMLEFQEMLIPGEGDHHESSPGLFTDILDGKNIDRVGASEPACASPLYMNGAENMVEELTLRNYNGGNLNVLGSSSMREKMQNKQNHWQHLYHRSGGTGSGNLLNGAAVKDNRGETPSVWEDEGSPFFPEFLDKISQNESQNEMVDCSPKDENKTTLSNALLSPGGIRTKILSKSGFSEYFVKNTLNGKGVICRGLARDAPGMVDSNRVLELSKETMVRSSYGIPDARHTLSQDHFRDGVSLREWLKGGQNKVNKTKSLYIFKQILDLVDLSHSRGVPLEDLRPSFFKLLPADEVIYLGLPAQKESVESVRDKQIYLSDKDRAKKRALEQENFLGASQSSKRIKFGDNMNSFRRWPQFPIRSGTKYGDITSTVRFQQDSGYGFNGEDLPKREDMIQRMPKNTHVSQTLPSYASDSSEEQWYASPEELGERCCTLPSNIYALGILLFELLGSFDSARSHIVSMLDLRQRILPPNFLSEHPKEAGFCLWLLHPEPSSRPTIKEILQSKVISGIPDLSRDELCSSIEHEDVESELLQHFLTSLKEQKQKGAAKLVEDIRYLEFDIAEVEKRRRKKSLALSRIGEIYGNSRYRNEDHPTTETSLRSSSSSCVGESRLMSNIQQLESAYFSVRSDVTFSGTDIAESANHEVLTSRENFHAAQKVEMEGKPVDRLGVFFDGLCKYARYSKFEVRGVLRNGDFNTSANVICSLSFDRDEDYFATAGVSKKIKVYDFHALLNDSVDIHYPAIEMSNKSKLSCICWNSYIRNYLASTDYDGVVKLWDAGSGLTVSHHSEHDRRAWSVDFSRVDPTKLASGSDDCSVKLWSINEKNSLSTIRTIANVCCVQFSPYSTHLLSFGSADYKTYCYDLRNVSNPLCILAGHDRAVSYVKFLDSETLVSASTDNTLKLWDLKKTNYGGLSTDGCTITFRGHTNEKNFVGLSVADGYIACGSETNEVFSYYKSLPMPIASHQFGSIDPISGRETENDNNQFVSSVCWRQKSDMVVAANSSGCLKLLQMV